MSELKDQVEEIFAAVAELREIAGDGPATRKLLDSLFRKVHSVKATASTNGLHELAAASHELENVLHSLRGGEIALDESVISSEMRGGLTQAEKHAVQQSLQEGASLFLVQTSFDV
ncbi:MAG TPA: Hpt domain-containing protein, partial [Pyrinomonadaceae bacterium]|nr:Hpt domain-containing protein [Pyrinomonadaceae bacterium]